MVETKPVIFQHKQNVLSEQVCANIRRNASRVLPNVGYKMICVCASGPSLAENVERVKDFKAMGFDVASMNGSHNFLIENGIIPDFYFQVDAREGLNLPFLRLANDHTRYVIASQCDPEIFDALEGRNVHLWQVGNADYAGAAEAIRELVPMATVFSGSCNVGHSSLKALVAMGYRVMRLYGFDGPTRSGTAHAFDQPQNASDEMLEWFFEGERFVGSATSAHDAQAFVTLFRQLRAMGISMSIAGDGLLPTMVSAAQRNDAGVKAVPQAIKRTVPVDKMRFVCWKWKGHIPYTAEHVNTLARMIGRWYAKPYDVVCITDDAEGIDSNVRIVPMWGENFEHGFDWHRLRIFSPEMIDVIGSRFVSMDLDTVICGDITELFDGDEPFKAWKDPNRPNQYCTALFQMDAGAYPHVFSSFDKEKALALRTSGKFTGYDQAWISEVLPGMPVWTPLDGVVSFKIDVLEGGRLPDTEFAQLPDGAKIVNFHGQYDPTHENVRRACPWVDEFYR